MDMEADWKELRCRSCGHVIQIHMMEDGVEFRHNEDGSAYGLSYDALCELLTCEVEHATTTDGFQYPEGTDLLWMAHYRKDPDGGDMDGPVYKLSGTFQQAAEEANRIAVTKGLILQCLRRRY